MARKKNRNRDLRQSFPAQCREASPQQASANLSTPIAMAESEEAIPETWDSFLLPVFNGSTDYDAIDEWIWKMESFFFATRKTESQKVFYGANQLTGPAHSWWRSHANPGDKASWDSFKTLLKDFFGSRKEEIQRPKRFEGDRGSKNLWPKGPVKMASTYKDRANPQTVHKAMAIASHIEQKLSPKGPDNAAVTRENESSSTETCLKTSVETAGFELNEFGAMAMLPVPLKESKKEAVMEEEERAFTEPWLKSSAQNEGFQKTDFGAMAIASHLEQKLSPKGPDNAAVMREEESSSTETCLKTSVETAGFELNEFGAMAMLPVPLKESKKKAVMEEEERAFTEPWLKSSAQNVGFQKTDFGAMAMASSPSKHYEVEEEWAFTEPCLKSSFKSAGYPKKEFRATTVAYVPSSSGKFTARNTNEDRRIEKPFPTENTYSDTKNYLVKTTAEDCYYHSIKGKVLGRDIRIATASTCSHNFIAAAIVMEMKLQTGKCKPFILDCDGKKGSFLYDDFVPGLTFHLGTETMTDSTDFYVINMNRNDMVLGQPWLSKQRMRPYRGSSMKLLLQGKWVEVPDEEDGE